jgi:hypothetical protein
MMKPGRLAQAFRKPSHAGADLGTAVERRGAALAAVRT